jgi:hypothetical protein
LPVCGGETLLTAVGPNLGTALRDLNAVRSPAASGPAVAVL